MAKRRRASGWASVMQRSMTAFTRTVMKAGSRAVTQAVGRAAKEAVRQAAAAPVRPAKPARRVRAANAAPRPRGSAAQAEAATLLACAAPARFRAVVMHSGVAPGAADSTASALSAMFSGRRAAALGPTEGEGGAPLPPLLVIHGGADHVVAIANARHAVDAWAAAAGARAAAPRRVQRGQRRAMTITEHRRARRNVATLCEVEGLGHAWSGGAASQDHGDPTGPDAARLVVAFVARAFAATVASLTPVRPHPKAPLLRG